MGIVTWRLPHIYFALFSTLLAVDVASGHEHGNLACWTGDFSFKSCCIGIVGNPSCWQPGYDYLTCCVLVQGQRIEFNIEKIAWGVLEALSRVFPAGANQKSPPHVHRALPDYDCRAKHGGVDWDEFADLSQEQAEAWTEGTLERTPSFRRFELISYQIIYRVERSVRECILGVMMLLSFLAGHAVSNHDYFAFDLFACCVDLLIQRGGMGTHVLASSRWPFFPVMHALQAERLALSQTHFARNLSQPFLAGVVAAPGEFRRLHEGALASLLELDFLPHQTQDPLVPPVYAAILQAVKRVHGQHGTSSNTIIFTFCFGEVMSSILREYSRHLGRIWGLPLVVMTGDDVAYRECVRAGRPLECVVAFGLSDQLGKHIVIHALLTWGFDALFVDLDAVIVRDPRETLAGIAVHKFVDILFMTIEPGCKPRTPVLYVRHNSKTRSLFYYLVQWLHTHPYHFEQTAFGNFLQMARQLRHLATLPNSNNFLDFILGDFSPLSLPSDFLHIADGLAWDRIEYPPTCFIEQNYGWTGHNDSRSILVYHRSNIPLEDKLEYMHAALHPDVDLISHAQRFWVPVTAFPPVGDCLAYMDGVISI